MSASIFDHTSAMSASIRRLISAGFKDFSRFGLAPERGNEWSLVYYWVDPWVVHAWGEPTLSTSIDPYVNNLARQFFQSAGSAGARKWNASERVRVCVSSPRYYLVIQADKKIYLCICIKQHICTLVCSGQTYLEEGYVGGLERWNRTCILSVTMVPFPAMAL